LAQHSPEPQTMAERLTAQQQATHEQPAPDPKAQLKERREASKRQRKADKAKRKADKKAAKQARKSRSKPETQPGPLDLDPLSPTTVEEQSQPVSPPVDLPPISPPGATPSGRSTRRTAALIGGIDLGGTKIAAAVLDADHKVVAYRRRPTPDKGGPADVVRAMAVTMQEAAIDAGTEAHRLLAVGVGSPGSVNTETGAVSGAGNLPDWDGTFQLGMALREELGTEVRVGNDVQVGTRAEYELGAGADYSSLLGVFWGTGVGGGIIINGEPWLGRGRAGEIGHTLVRRGGAKGLNGLNGTVEAYAGRKAMEAKARREVKKGRKTKLFKLMKKHEKTHLTSAIWQRALEDGDELAEDLLNRAVAALSAGIGSAINLLDPEAVVIGGGLGVRFADTLVPEIIDGMKPYLLNKENPPEVKVAALGDEGGVIGASLLVKDVIEANQSPSA
jgi:glucokinase